jgi:hypothetical protein
MVQGKEVLIHYYDLLPGFYNFWQMFSEKRSLVTYKLSGAPSCVERRALIPPQRLWPMTTMTLTLSAQTAYSTAEPMPVNFFCQCARVEEIIRNQAE